MRERTTILFLASNPKHVQILYLDEEIRAITKNIRAADYRDVIDLKQAWALRPDDLQQALLEIKPTVVHFSGHGSPSGELVLMDDSHNANSVSSEALKDIFITLKDNIKVVVLNACYSKIQGDAIAEVIDCVVGMNTSIGDQAAIIFAASFYRAIGFGRSVKEAFDLGITSLKFEKISEENTPELLHRADIDPAKVYLVLDYNSIDKIDADPAGHIILKDVNGSVVTINYNDIENLKPVLHNLSDAQTFEVKQLIGSQHQEILTEIRRIQEKSDEKNTIQKTEVILDGLDDFFKDIAAMRIENTKNLIITLYKLLRDYEEKIILEEDPKRKKRYQVEIDSLKVNIATNETELINILRQQ